VVIDDTTFRQFIVSSTLRERGGRLYVRWSSAGGLSACEPELAAAVIMRLR
jgi:hypothetical protein